MPDHFELIWIDSGREPQCPPNPAYPVGIDVDLSHGATMSCMVALPYPAPRCGYHLVWCKRCNSSAIITTAGRPDDPRSVKFECLGERNG